MSIYRHQQAEAKIEDRIDLNLKKMIYLYFRIAEIEFIAEVTNKKKYASIETNINVRLQNVIDFTIIYSICISNDIGTFTILVQG